MWDRTGALVESSSAVRDIVNSAHQPSDSRPCCSPRRCVIESSTRWHPPERTLGWPSSHRPTLDQRRRQRASSSRHREPALLGLGPSPWSRQRPSSRGTRCGARAENLRSRLRSVNHDAAVPRLDWDKRHSRLNIALNIEAAIGGSSEQLLASRPGADPFRVASGPGPCPLLTMTSVREVCP